MPYMVCHGSHQYTPVMLAFFYQHHGSYGFSPSQVTSTAGPQETYLHRSGRTARFGSVGHPLVTVGGRYGGDMQWIGFHGKILTRKPHIQLENLYGFPVKIFL